MNRSLIVEDNEDVRDLLEAFMDFTGKFSDIDAVASGEEALELFEPGKYKLVTLDIKLITMNGVDVALEIRKQDPDVVILGVTGYSQIVKECDMSVAGFNECFTKPMEYRKFLEFVKNME